MAKIVLMAMVLLAASLLCAQGQDGYCGKDETYGDLVLKFPSSNSGPMFFFWYTDDDKTRYKVELDRVDAFNDQNGPVAISKNLFSSWQWEFVCDVNCANEMCTFEYMGQNSKKESTMFADIVGHVSDNSSSTNSFKFDIHLYGSEVETLLQNASRLEITFKFLCTQGSCNDPSDDGDDEATLSGTYSYANLDIRGDFVRLFGSDENCTLTLSDDGDETDTGSCGMSNYLLVVNNKKPVLSISWEDGSEHTDIMIDPTVRVGSSAALMASMVLILAALVLGIKI